MRSCGLLVLVAIGACVGGITHGQTPVAKPPHITIPRLSRPPTLEDFAGMKPSSTVANEMLKIEGLIQRDPEDGKPASQRTEIYIGWDDKNFYAIFLCFDSKSELVRARMGRREAIDGDDIAGVFLDTYHDHQRTYEFFTNPYGIQMDGIAPEGQNDDYSWDTLWDSSGHLTPQGYMTRIALPFKSLRFPRSDSQVWGIGFFRVIPRNNEQSFWPRVTRKIEGFSQQLAEGEGIHGISPGRNLQFIPYGVFGKSRFRDTRDFDAGIGPPVFQNPFDKRLGMDTKVVLKDTLTLDVALNPDFSQVESDDPQVTVNQRFEVFFPEKRPFFIENASYFSTPFNLFFSRRIGDPQFGARVTGKVDGWALGALVIDDRGPGESVPDSDPLSGDRALFGVFRADREFKNQSSMGVIFTDREFGGGYNRVGGADFRWKINKNWVASGQALASATLNTDGTYQAGPAYTTSIYRSSRTLNFAMNYEDISPGFTTQTGFVPRTGVRDIGPGFNYRWYPKKSKALVDLWVNSNYQGYWDHTGLRLEHDNYNTLGFEFRRSTVLGFFRNEFLERLRPVDFSSLTAPHDYPHHGTGMFFNSDFFKKVGVGLTVVEATRINYDAATGRTPFVAKAMDLDPSLTLRPFSKLRIDNTYLMTRFNERTTNASVFINHIVRSKWNWQFNREFSFRMIWQYNSVLANPVYSSLNTTKNANADFLLTWLLHPGTAVYIGYNSNLRNLDPTGSYYTRRTFINDGRTAFIKVSWLFRY